MCRTILERDPVPDPRGDKKTLESHLARAMDVCMFEEGYKDMLKLR
jgi:hypothetical protein